MANHSCVMIKYAKDQRYSKDSISTHDKAMTKAASCSHLSQIRETVKQFGVIGIDEGQFVSVHVSLVWLHHVSPAPFLPAVPRHSAVL